MIDIIQIKKYLDNPIKNFLSIDIRYTKKEQHLLKYLDINKNSAFEYYGNIYEIDKNKFHMVLNNIGKMIKLIY